MDSSDIKLIYKGSSQEQVTDKDIEYAINQSIKKCEQKDQEASEKAGKEIKTHYVKSITFDIRESYIMFQPEIGSAPFDRIRRITGYLVGTTDRFNDAKRAEEHDRVKHSFNKLGG